MKKIKETFSYMHLYIYFVIIVIVFIDFILAHVIKINTASIIEKVANVAIPFYLNKVRPEPLEKMLYMVTAVLAVIIPFLLCSIIYFFHEKYIIRSLLFQKIEDFLSKIDLIIIALLITICFWGDDFTYINRFFFTSIQNIILSLIILITFIYLYIKNKKILTYIITFFLILIFIFSAYIMILQNGSYYLISHHYNAYIESIVAVMNGKTLFINHFNQYGFYPYFFLMFFKIFDFNIRNFSILMFLMLAIANIANLYTLSMIIKNKLIKLLVFFNIIFFTMIYTYYYFEGKINFLDYYYQYFPHRYFFPSIIICLFVLYVKNSENKFYHNLYCCLLIVVTSISILWNIDTGLICYISCLAGLIYYFIGKGKILKKRIIFEIIIYFFMVPILSLLILQIITYIRVRSFVQILELFKFIKFFYSSGFAMILMKIPHSWILIALIYILGISISIINISGKFYYEKYQEKPIHQINTFLFFISVMGVGLFSYYQGRSHDANLYKVASCAFIVLGLLMDNYNEIFRLNNKKNKVSLLIMILLFAIPISFLMDMNKTVSILNMKNIENNMKISNNEIKEIENYLKPDEKIIILSGMDNESYISMSLRRSNPIAKSSIVEMFYKKDYDEFLDKLFNNTDKKVLLDKDFLYMDDTYLDLLLSDKYKIIYEGEKFLLLEYNKNMGETGEKFKKNLIKNYNGNKVMNYFWLKNNFIFSSFKENESNNIVDFLDKNEKNYVNFIGRSIEIDYPQKFTVELIVEPKSNEKNTPNAAIIGNHNEFLGFIVMKDNQELNSYVVSYGTGKSWMTTDSFYLKENQEQYISIIFDKNKISVYLDGKLVVENQFEEAFKDAEMSTYIGNWQGHDRPFSGEISEVVIIDRVLTPNEIKENWNNLTRNMNN